MDLPKSAPPAEWGRQSLQHFILAGLMNSGQSTPEQMEQFLRGADLSGACLRGAYLSGATVSIGNVYRKISKENE
jgi:uncharacterized protein YjbI with pentapeptide repeats